MLEAADKTAIIARHRRDDQDTGSPEVQIALLTTRILQLTDHLKRLPKDFHSRRGLYGLVARRKKLMGYLKRTNPARYRELCSELGLRG